MTSLEIFKIFSLLQIIELMVIKKWYNGIRDEVLVIRELNRYIATKSKEVQDIINKYYMEFIIN